MNPQTNPSSPILPQKLQGFVLFSRHGTLGKMCTGSSEDSLRKQGERFIDTRKGHTPANSGFFRRKTFSMLPMHGSSEYEVIATVTNAQMEGIIKSQKTCQCTFPRKQKCREERSRGYLESRDKEEPGYSGQTPR